MDCQGRLDDFNEPELYLPALLGASDPSWPCARIGRQVVLKQPRRLLYEIQDIGMLYN